MSNIFKEFKEFAMRGNMVDMATGIIIGGAFGTIVKSLVDDVIMPPIGMLLGGVDFSNLFFVLKQGKTLGPYNALANAKAAGAVTINYGLFFNSLISFLIVAFAVFLLIKGMNSLRRKPGGGGGTDHQELPLLRHFDPDRGYPVSALHLRAEIDMKLPPRAPLTGIMRVITTWGRI